MARQGVTDKCLSKKQNVWYRHPGGVLVVMLSGVRGPGIMVLTLFNRNTLSGFEIDLEYIQKTKSIHSGVVLSSTGALKLNLRFPSA